MSLRSLADRLEAATPAGRDRGIDVLRALAIAGVIGGHWLVTSLVVKGGALVDTSPLAAHPELAPLSWVFQTLAVFFLVGGYSAARSYRGGYAAWLRARLVRLARPVVALLTVWAALTAVLALAGISAATIATLVVLVLSPLWFLCVYVLLTALTPLVVAAARRFGAQAALAPLAVVGVVDLARLHLGAPSWIGWVNVLAGWLVPYLLGAAWAAGAFRSRTAPALLLAGGAAATALLVLFAGYPASMVGVNGAKISNLNPPTLAVVTFGIAQTGLALLLRPHLARCRGLAWAAVAMANLSAMTLFCWHQTAMLTVTMAGLLVGHLPGLHTDPTSLAWIAERLVWLPAFAVALAALWSAFRGVETRSPSRAPGRGVPGRAERVPGRAAPAQAPPSAAPPPSTGPAWTDGPVRTAPSDAEEEVPSGALTRSAPPDEPTRHIWSRAVG